MTLSIIIVSYNTKELLEQCLESIVKSLTNSNSETNRHPDENQDHPNGSKTILNQVQNDDSGKSVKNKAPNISYEIIVVDNNSTDGTREYLEKLQTTNFKFQISSKLQTNSKIPTFAKASAGKQNLKVILNEENTGFTKANNQGIKESRGEYVLLLNSDTRITEKNFFTKIIAFLDKNKQVGILGPKLVWENGQVQPSGGYFPTLPRLFTWALMLDDLPLINKIIKPYHPHEPGFYTKDSYYQKSHYQDWVTGACFFIKRAVINKIGLLDENIFMYTEEMEYCYRAQKFNFKIVYYPQASLIHLGGKSGTSLSAAKNEFWGIKYFYQKHQPTWQKIIVSFLLKKAAFLRKIVFYNNQEKRNIYRQILADL